MKKGRKYTQEEISVISQSAIGKTFGELLKSDFVSFGEAANKGGLGQLIETYLFGIDSNSDSEPDFIDAGIELKVTPYKRNKNNTLSAKERLVLNIIDYKKENKNQFETSHFWFKNNKIQLLWYLANDKASSREDKLNYIITHEHLLNLKDSEGFGINGTVVGFQPIKSRSNATKVTVPMIFDTTHGLFDNELSIFYFLKQQGKVKGAGIGLFFEGAEDVRFSMRNFKEKLHENRDLQLAFAKVARETLEELLSDTRLQQMQDKENIIDINSLILGNAV